MKIKRKRKIIIYSMIVALFIVPLVVFAVVYYSNERTNNFAPGSVNIKVHEGDGNENEGPIVTKVYTWPTSATNGQYLTDKEVQVRDTRKYPGEALRVCFVPMWYDKETPANACGAFNFKTSGQTGNTLIYTDGDKTITLNLAIGWDTSGWSYSDPNGTPPGDGFFYYTGSLDSNKLTPQLLESVGLNDKAYELTKNYDFRLDVLADAVQKDHQNSSGTASPRW